MKTTIDKKALKEFMGDSKYYQAVEAILLQQIKTAGSWSGMLAGGTYDEQNHHTIHIMAWCDMELIYTKLGKLKEVKRTIHSLQVSRPTEYRTEKILFEKYSTDSYGAIRPDRKTESEVA